MTSCKSIGVFLFHGAEELDWAGPWEVLGAWSVLAPEESKVFTVAREPGLVRCAKGLRVMPDYDWTTSPPIEVLVYPGGEGVRSHIGDLEIRSWLCGLRATGTLLTSVCTGALVYADAGLLDGHAATTHWQALERLGGMGSRITVRRQERVVDDGSIVTAAGVSAGIDMALHLVARLSSPQRAEQVRKYIQYEGGTAVRSVPP